MSFATRDWLHGWSPNAHTAAIPVEVRGPHPTLVDVLARHPRWRRRLTRMLAIDPRDRDRIVTRDLRAAQRRRAQRNLRKRDAG